MTVDALKRILPAPAEGVEHDWRAVEDRLGIKLPSDYKDFVDAYGTGAIGDFLWVLTPATSNPNLNLFEKGREMLRAYEELRHSHPREYPFQAYPPPGGVLPWAVTDNGDELYWITSGEPEEWPTVIYATSAGSYERIDTPMTELLTKWLNGSLHTDVLVSVIARFDSGGQ